MLRGIRAIDDVNERPKKVVRNLFIEKLAAMYISMQETFMNLQNKIHACKARELNLQHAMEIQNIEMKSLIEEHAVKNRIRKLEREILNLDAVEVLMKANVEMKSMI